MKKAVKSLIIAASVAAIAGIGAVSFAAWSGASDKTANTTELTGTVEAVGFASSTVTNTGKKLMPIDQEQSALGEDGVYYYVVALKTSGTDFTGYKITVKAEGVSDSTVPTGLKCAILSSAPSTGSEATLTGSWVSLYNTAESPKDLQTTVEDDTTYNVYIALESDNTDYASNAGKNFKVTFTLTK